MSRSDELSEATDNEFDAEYPDERHLKFMSKMNDLRFGEMQLFSLSTTSERVLSKTRVFKGRSELKIAVRRTQLQIRNSHKNVQRVLGFSSRTDRGFCFPTYSLTTFHLHPIKDLEEKLEELLILKRRLTGSDLLKIAVHCLLGLGFVHNQMHAYGDVRPRNIGIDVDDNYFLLDPLLIGSTRSEALKGNIGGKGQLFISPKIHYMLCTGKDEKGRQKDWKDPNGIKELQKSDIFALGMTLLHLGVEKRLDCYSPYGDFNNADLEATYEEFKTIFLNQNVAIVEMVGRMLEVSEEKRPDAKSLLSYFFYFCRHNDSIDHLGGLDIAYLQKRDREGKFNIDLQEIENCHRNSVDIENKVAPDIKFFQSAFSRKSQEEMAVETTSQSQNQNAPKQSRIVRNSRASRKRSSANTNSEHSSHPSSHFEQSFQNGPLLRTPSQLHNSPLQRQSTNQENRNSYSYLQQQAFDLHRSSMSFHQASKTILQSNFTQTQDLSQINRASHLAHSASQPNTQNIHPNFGGFPGQLRPQ